MQGEAFGKLLASSFGMGIGDGVRSELRLGNLVGATVSFHQEHDMIRPGACRGEVGWSVSRELTLWSEHSGEVRPGKSYEHRESGEIQDCLLGMNCVLSELDIDIPISQCP